MSRIKSYTNQSGRTVHYDENGNRVGISYRSPSGGQAIHCDADGNRVGRSYISPAGRMTHYNESGKLTGRTFVSPSGNLRHYDSQRNTTGETRGTFFGTTTNGQAGKPAQGTRPGPEKAGTGCLAVLLLICGIFGLMVMGLMG